jgi:NAD-dependent deacetylase
VSRVTAACVWTCDPDAEKLVTLSWYLRDPAIRRRSWLLRRDLATADVRPNAGHAALAQLERQGRLRALLTQNVREPISDALPRLLGGE